MEKIAVLGGTGMAGHVISQYLLEKGFSVTSISRSNHPMVPSILCDAENYSKLYEVIVAEKFTLIINCIGILNDDAKMNKSKSILINSFLPNYLSEKLINTNIRIIHLSTDCVFSGENGPYLESAIPNGTTFYDRTKIIGELINHKDITFRNSLIGPDLKKQGIGLFNWFMNQCSEIYGYKRVLWNGVTTITLAKAIEYYISRPVVGLYHLVSDPVSKYTILEIFRNSFAKKNNILASNEPVSNKCLINTRVDFEFIIPTHVEMINEMKKWIYAHKEFYPHYFYIGGEK
ncbi:MAG: sugar nucleotide-binding protein [Firmicutes bacterium]|nr:sugar nucleotide-binding protein [Bacillota bacterium]